MLSFKSKTFFMPKSTKFIPAPLQSSKVPESRGFISKIFGFPLESYLN
jgi:hypothetical protein